MEQKTTRPSKLGRKTTTAAVRSRPIPKPGGVVAIDGFPHPIPEKKSSTRGDLEAFIKIIRLSSPPPNSYLVLMGMEPRETFKLLADVKKGFEYEVFEHFQRFLGLSTRDVAALLRIPASTLIRRKSEGRLNSAESERLLRFMRLFGLAIELFGGDTVAARRWMLTSKRPLNDKPPLEMASTELGAREVENLIGRLEHGVYT